MLTERKAILTALQNRFPEVTIRGRERFYVNYSISNNKITKMEVFYNDFCTSITAFSAGILHEFGHYLDKDLWDNPKYINKFKSEVTAWQIARRLAEELDMFFDEDHMNDCLDTYNTRLTRPEQAIAHQRIRNQEYRF